MPAVSRKQQALMGMALAHKRNGGDASPEVRRLAESMSESDLHDFAATKHKGLPKKANLNQRTKVAFALGKVLDQLQ